MGILALYQKSGINPCEVVLNSAALGNANNRVNLKPIHIVKKEKK